MGGLCCCCFHVPDEQDSAGPGSCSCPKCWFKKAINKVKYENIPPRQSDTRSSSNRNVEFVISLTVSSVSSDSCGTSNAGALAAENPKDSHVQPESKTQTEIQLSEKSQERPQSVDSRSEIGSQGQKFESWNEKYILTDADEDVCPTCFEEYTEENPKITAHCAHHYHLACIYEWMERSELCPACRRLMEF